MTSNLFLISFQNLWFTVDLEIGEWPSGLKRKVLSLILLNSVRQDEGKKLVFWNMAYAVIRLEELRKIRKNKINLDLKIVSLSHGIKKILLLFDYAPTAQTYLSKKI